MNSLKTALIMLLMALFTVPAAWCGIAEELLTIDKELTQLAVSVDGNTVAREKDLRAREIELFTGLLKSAEAAESFLQKISGSNAGLAERFLSRLRFEISQEARSDLRPILEKWNNEKAGDPVQIREKKKVAFIYGCEVNLHDGQWHNAPDGRRFWISNEFPDIILSPAEYQRYLKSAAVIED